MSRYMKSDRGKYLDKYAKHKGTQKSFCESEGISVGTLQYWLRSSRKEESPGFVEVVTSTSSGDFQYLEITTRSGTTIRIPL